MPDWKYLAKELIGDGRYKLIRNAKTVRAGYEQYADEFRRHPSPRNIILCYPQHNNIGDHAIGYAETRILGEQDKELLVFGGDMTKILSCLREFVTPDDVIYLHGGGNMGSLYAWEEQYRCDIISLTHRNKVIMFPQTISYDDDERSQRLLRHTQVVYGRHPNLHLFARERTSYERMRRYYPNNDVQLVPDIVLSLSGQDTADFSQRHGVLLCMRNDVEKVTSNDAAQRIEQAAQSTGEPVRYTDTTVPDDMSVFTQEKGERLVLEKFEEFRNARLVITDRLHGMIFSAVTGTPCIALNNSNGKVGMEYYWLRDLPYISFIERAEDIDAVLPQLMGIQGTRFPSEEFAPKFQPLWNLI